METVKGDRLRAFLAIPIDTGLKEKIQRLQQQLSKDLPEVRWSRSENLHLTLRFFADIEAESLEKAAKLMLSVDPLGSRFELHFEHLGAFPSTTRPRVVWLGFKDNPALNEIYRRSAALLKQAGIPPESRPFKPHLTLGRARGKLGDITTLLQRYEKQFQSTLSVDHLVLYRSRLLPQGAEHTPLYTFDLGDRHPS